jgi:DNA-binding transcriptional regulator YdaS (Cro superfamily)
MKQIASGEFDIDDLSSASETQSSKWDAIKKKLPPRHAEAIDILMLQGSMRRKQLAAALKMDYSNCSSNLIGPLLRQGWFVDNGGSLSLKDL